MGPLPLIKMRRIFENLLTLLPDDYAAKSNQMRDVIESNCNQYGKEKAIGFYPYRLNANVARETIRILGTRILLS